MSDFYLTITTLAVIYTFLVLSCNIAWGYSRLLNFGLIAFFAIGAYTSAILTSPPPESSAAHLFAFGLPVPVGMICGTLVAGAAAYLIGLSSIRLKGHYLAIGTFGFAVVTLVLIEQEAWLTGGYYGILNVPKFGKGLTFLSHTLFYLIFSIVILLIVLYILEKIGRSPFGRVLRGMGDDDLAAQTLGKHTNRFRLTSFMISGMIAGLGGALFVHYVGICISTQFTHMFTFMAWVAMLVGGSGKNKAVVMGSLIIFLGLLGLVRLIPILPSHPTIFASLRSILLGIVLIMIMRFRPQGLFSGLGGI